MPATHLLETTPLRSNWNHLGYFILKYVNVFIYKFQIKLPFLMRSAMPYNIAHVEQKPPTGTNKCIRAM